MGNVGSDSRVLCGPRFRERVVARFLFVLGLVDLTAARLAVFFSVAGARDARLAAFFGAAGARDVRLAVFFDAAGARDVRLAVFFGAAGARDARLAAFFGAAGARDARLAAFFGAAGGSASPVEREWAFFLGVLARFVVRLPAADFFGTRLGRRVLALDLPAAGASDASSASEVFASSLSVTRSPRSLTRGGV